MSYIKLSHLDTSFPDYNFVWNLVDSIITADPSSTIRLLVCDNSACSKHIYNALRHYSGFHHHFLINLEPFLDGNDRQRVEIVISKNAEVIE
tara:strand:- start:6265 stop:6540 length:276 start_codon:yes stop_codon:yes gene_type:complete